MQCDGPVSDYYVDGRYEQQRRAEVQYTVHKFELSEADNQALKMDASYIPMPSVNIRQRHEFSLPQNQQIVYVLPMNAQPRCSPQWQVFATASW